MDGREVGQIDIDRLMKKGKKRRRTTEKRNGK